MLTTKTQLKSLFKAARMERRKIIGQLSWLDRVIAKYSKLETTAVSAPTSKPKRKTTGGWTWSAAARKRQSKSMKASWAKRKALTN